VTPRVPVVRGLIHAYRVAEPAADALVQLARDANQRGWWQSYVGALTDQTASYVGFEAEAAAVRDYQSSVVPGLLQTADYARAVLKGFQLTMPKLDDELLEQAVTVRTRRQERLGEIAVWAITEEHVLRRPTGGPEIMRAQLAHLAKVCRARPNITFQILPNAVSSHPGFDGPFTVLEFADENDPDIGYIETQGGEMWLDQVEEVKRLNRTFDHLRAFAMSPEASIELLDELSRTA
jgi:hypothetical protein